MSFMWMVVMGIAGLLVGRAALIAAAFLPGALDKQWRQEAAEFLELEASTVATTCSADAVLGLLWDRARAVSVPGLVPFSGGRWDRHSFRWMGVEWGMALLGMAALFHFGAPLPAVAVLALAGALLAASIIDLKHMLLPDAIVQPLIWVGLALNSASVFTSLDSALYGALAGYLSLWSLYQAHRLLTGREGMGYGDFKLFAAIGAWGGVEVLPLVGLLAAGLAVSVQLLIRAVRARQGEQDEMAGAFPFGPYLAAAGLFSVLLGDSIVAWWLYRL